jgi:hypothetical protein
MLFKRTIGVFPTAESMFGIILTVLGLKQEMKQKGLI